MKLNILRVYITVAREREIQELEEKLRQIEKQVVVPEKQLSQMKMELKDKPMNAEIEMRDQDLQAGYIVKQQGVFIVMRLLYTDVQYQSLGEVDY